jgi:hypothetical protein
MVEAYLALGSALWTEVNLALRSALWAEGYLALGSEVFLVLGSAYELRLLIIRLKSYN